MDTKSLLDDILKTGKEYAEKGQTFAEEKLQMPAEGAERDAKIDGLKKGAMAAGVLALLLGTKGGRKLSGSALKLGSLAAIGGMGYTAYQKWVAEKSATEKQYKDMAEDIGKSNANDGTLVNFDKLDEKESENRSQVLLKAMIAAAKADGHVNSKEVIAIEEQITKLGLGDDTASLIQEEIAKPLDVKEVAALANGDQAMAAEIYLVSAVISNRENSMERDYLESLAEELGLPDALVAELQNVKSDNIA